VIIRGLAFNDPLCLQNPNPTISLSLPNVLQTECPWAEDHRNCELSKLGGGDLSDLEPRPAAPYIDDEAEEDGGEDLAEDEDEYEADFIDDRVNNEFEPSLLSYPFLTQFYSATVTLFHGLGR
jgi:hypothetical protein